MRDYSKVSPKFWIGKTGREIRRLGVEAQLIALYLFTSPHATMLGIYYLPITFIVHETGIPFEGSSKTLRSLVEVGFCTYDEESEYVWVHEMAFYQIGGQLKEADNRIKRINEDYQAVPKLPFLRDFYDKYHSFFFLENPRENISPFEDPSKTLRSQEQEQEQEQKQKKENIWSTSQKLPDVLKNEKNKILDEQAIEVLTFLNEKIIANAKDGKKKRGFRLVNAHLKFIRARLNDGISVQDCRSVIAIKFRQWCENKDMVNYLRPKTLFNATNFEQYLGELIVVEEENTENRNTSPTNDFCDSPAVNHW